MKEEEESDEEEVAVVKKIKKNPDVDTSFLPDREREEEENRLREELRQVTQLCLEVISENNVRNDKLVVIGVGQGDPSP